MHLVYRVTAPLPAEHWLNDPLQAAGRILGEACHMFDFANWLCGTPERVFAAALPAPPASARSRARRRRFSTLTARWRPSTTRASAPTSMPKERIEVLRGGRSWVLDDFSALTTYGPDGERTRDERAGDKGHAALLEHVLAACRGRGPFEPGLGAAYLAQSVALAALDSIASGEPVGRPAAAGQERLMCGICGILATRDGFDVGEELVTAMRETIVHRGPDDGGSWYSPDAARRPCATAGSRSSTSPRPATSR